MPNNKLIIGFSNSFHDASITFIQNDKIYAEALERHTQCKRSPFNVHLGSSARSIKQALASHGFQIDSQTEIIMRTTWRFNYFFEKLIFVAIKLLPDNFVNKFSYMVLQIYFSKLAVMKTNIAILKDILGSVFEKKIGLEDNVKIPSWLHGFLSYGQNLSIEIQKTDHHLTHAANAIYSSTFKECAVMIVDGAGESESITYFKYTNNKLRKISSVKVEHSLGFLYSTITRFVGFDPNKGEEWKVMGLAAYGSYNESLYHFFSQYTEINGLNVKLKFDNMIFQKLEKMVGGIRAKDDDNSLQYADLAYNFQLYFTEVISALANNLSKMNISNNLVYAGGCALNSSTNGVLLERTGFANVFVPCAPGDDGNSLGAAFFERYYKDKAQRPSTIFSPYAGSEILEKDILHVLNQNNIKYIKIEEDDELCERVSGYIANDKIIGWIQGKAEFGPRSLGNRSILANPCSQDIKERINAKVKFREEYRPFAPSILHEFGPEYFESYQESPYMERTLRFHDSVKDKIPGVVHVDGTGRLQTVKKEWNEKFYTLISHFHRKTNVPILLNTSLNVMGSPILHSINDAVTVLFTTGLDYIVVNNYILSSPKIKSICTEDHDSLPLTNSPRYIDNLN